MENNFKASRSRTSETVDQPRPLIACVPRHLALIIGGIIKMPRTNDFKVEY